MRKRVCFQQGSVVKKSRAKALIWVLRSMDGDVQRFDILGTIHKFETMVASPKEAAERLKEINERLAGIKVSDLCDRLKALRERANGYAFLHIIAVR
jgi:hypothetical protein